MCPQTPSFMSIGPKFVGPQSYKFLHVDTLKNPSVFTFNFRLRHFSNALLCP